MTKKTFYRVCNAETQQGLWYDFSGTHTGLIHDEFAFCKNKNLPMPYDPMAVGWLSATETREELYEWFPVEDIIRLQKHGYFLYLYESSIYKQHHNHWLISQRHSQIIEQKIMRISPEKVLL
ncbi:MAG: hypothetical protein BGO40_02825 [Chryseobacterium sp. 39-10]|nr:hypothetical protein [Chryseobacterium sp.]OJV46512.1 MAG: hypothetical protein BGO40_02825 [Chryseobacterium sp. 39-10]